MLRSNSKSLGNPCSQFYILRSVQDSKVGDTVSTFVVKYSMLQFFLLNFATLVRVCPAVISLTAFSH